MEGVRESANQLRTTTVSAENTNKEDAVENIADEIANDTANDENEEEVMIGSSSCSNS